MLDLGEAFEIDPVMPPPLIDRDTRRREIVAAIRCAEEINFIKLRASWRGHTRGLSADNRIAAQFPIDGRAALRAETEGDCATTVAFAREGRALARDAGHILAGESRLHAEGGAGPSLAVEAMADRDAKRLAVGNDLQLTAGTGGLARRHLGRLVMTIINT